MKQSIFFFVLIFSITILSQTPTYYNDVNLTLSGTALKDELAIKVISTHITNLSYTPGVWDALKQSDLDPTNTSKVLLIYGWNDADTDITNDRTRGKDVNGGGSGVWNREHVYSKSLAEPNLGTSGPGADAHNLRPCDAQKNSSRSNRKFEDGSGNSGITASGNWYPGDEWKGDVARMMMYMYLRYGNQTLPIGVGVGNTNVTDSNMIDLFLEWNAEDPVSAVELQRNPILENLQGNRNPFIDNPAFATQIWGGPQAENKFGNGTGNSDTQPPSIPTNLVASNISQTTLNVSWLDSIDDTGVIGYSIYNGTTQIGTTSNTSFTVTGLTAGTTYSFSVKAYDAAANVSENSNSISITTISSGNGIASELLISEYVEGSSNNKVIEIANFTGIAVNLSSYSLKKATNGSGSFTSNLALNGNLGDGQVYIIVHGSANASLISIADTTNSGVMSFNGNDAVGLFKDDVLIDLIGNASSNSNFAQNITLKRKSTISNPNTVYDPAEYDSFPIDTFNDLGVHFIDGGSLTDVTPPSVPSNLLTSVISQTSVNLNWIASTDNILVTGYNIYQNNLKIATVTDNSFAVSNLIAETAYNFYVTAFDAAENISAASNTEYITTLPIPDIIAPSAPTNLSVSNITQTSAELSWTASTDNVLVTGYDILDDTTVIASINSTNYTLTNLTEDTTFNFSVRAKDEAFNISLMSNVVNVTTASMPVNGTTSELLISEYIEGSSNNKALEIANFTGSNINLSGYALKKATNGSGAFSSVLNLSGTLNDGQVYVVANSNANAAILSIANITNASVLTFNGNDAIGLFKNDILIDIIGNANSSDVFAQNITLQRKTSVTTPNSIYAESEWDVFGQDTFSNLGNHFIDGGIIPDIIAPTAPINLSTTDIAENSLKLTWVASLDDTGVSSYDLFQDGILIGNTTVTNFIVNGLQLGNSYNFTAIAKDLANNISNSSNIANATTVDVTAPSIPSNILISNIKQTSLDIAWSSATDNVSVTGYEILNGGTIIGFITETSFSVSGLSENTNYDFTIIAKDAAGNSTESNLIFTTTLAQPTNTSTILSESYFESGWDNWIDGGNDCYRYSGSRSFEGNSSIRIRDNSGTASAMTSEIYDLTSFDSVEIEFHFYSYSMENNEDFWLRFYDGSTWITAATYAKGTDFENNNFYTATVVLNANTYSFTNNASFRFQNDASGNADHIYIDEVIITGKTGSTSAKGGKFSLNSVSFLRSLNTTELDHFKDDFMLYPNPVSGNSIRIQLQHTDSENIYFTISNTLGQIVKKGKLTNNSIAVNKLNKGVYIITINDGEETMIKKFIKK